MPATWGRERSSWTHHSSVTLMESLLKNGELAHVTQEMRCVALEEERQKVEIQKGIPLCGGAAWINRDPMRDGQCVG